MINVIIQDIKNFYDITVFLVILLTGVFLILWDYPTFKTLKHKNDTRVTLVMGIMYMILPFVLYTISRM